MPGFQTQAPAKASLAKQRNKGGLLEVLVRSQRLSKSAAAHHHKRNAIHPTPFLVRPLAEQLPPLAAQLLREWNDLDQCRSLQAFHQLDGRRAESHFRQRITDLERHRAVS